MSVTASLIFSAVDLELFGVMDSFAFVEKSLRPKSDMAMSVE